MAAVTRLGLYGGPRRLYGSFAGRVVNVVADAVSTGGGKGRIQRPGRAFSVEPPKKKKAPVIPFQSSGPPGQILQGEDLPPEMPVFGRADDRALLPVEPLSLPEIQQLIDKAWTAHVSSFEQKQAEEKEAQAVLEVRNKLLVFLEREETQKTVARDVELMLLLMMVD